MSFQYAFLDPFAYFDTPRENLPAPSRLSGSHPGPIGNPKEGLDTNPFSSIKFFNTPLQLGYEESARLPLSEAGTTQVNSFSHALVMYQQDAPVYALDLDGQGTISVSVSAAAELCICISSTDRSRPSLYLDINPTSCTFSYGYYTSATVIPARPPPESPYIGAGGGVGSGPGMYLDVNRQTTYWLSIDCPNGILKYGKGYLSSNLTLLEARLKKVDDHGCIIWPEDTWTFLENLKEVRVLQTGGDMRSLSVTTQTLPLVDAPSPYVIPDYRISMNDLESNDYTVVANLPVECQVSSSSHFVAPDEHQLTACNDLFTASDSLTHNLATPNLSSDLDNAADATMFSPLENSFNYSLTAPPPLSLPAVDPPSGSSMTAVASTLSTSAPASSSTSTSTLSSPFTSAPLVRRPNANVNTKHKTTPKSKLKINTNLRRKPSSPSHRFIKPIHQPPTAPVSVPLAPLLLPTLPPLTLNTLHCPYYSAHYPQPTCNTAASKICTAADPQKLYANVAGPNIVLNTPDFPAFGRAIERSVNTEGCLGYSLLMRKAGEFSKKGKIQGGGGRGKDEKPDLTQTYLRITLGSHMVNSPGIPYVLEIWPAGHYSPVHEHADSFAIIKVLYGTINAFFYDSLVNPGGPRMIMDKVELNTGDITWISPQHYQVHQLKNLSKRKEDGGEGTVCCTLQCYQYAYNDKIHYENFRYIPNSNSNSSSRSSPTSSPNDSGYESGPDMMDFQPNSDMSFGVFKAAIRREWEDYMSTAIGKKEESEYLASERARIAKGDQVNSDVAKKAAEMAELLAERERLVEMGSMEARAEAVMMEVGQ